MGVLIGSMMLSFGIIGTIFSCAYMNNDTRYSYRPPFTDHETTILFIFTICVLVAAVGFLVMLFSVIKKRQSDSLDKLLNTTNDGAQKNICPYCGLNIAEGILVCPKCRNTIRRNL